MAHHDIKLYYQNIFIENKLIQTQIDFRQFFFLTFSYNYDIYEPIATWDQILFNSQSPKVGYKIYKVYNQASSLDDHLYQFQIVVTVLIIYTLCSLPYMVYGTVNSIICQYTMLSSYNCLQNSRQCYLLICFISFLQ